MVPLTVYFGDEAYLDWVELKPHEFYEKLMSSPVLPRTSQPSAGDFLVCYRTLRERYERVYSVHLSSVERHVGQCRGRPEPDRRGTSRRLRPPQGHWSAAA
jgi:hypothetical protein